MSDGRKGFFARIVENVKQEMTVNPEMKVRHPDFTAHQTLRLKLIYCDSGLTLAQNLL